MNDILFTMEPKYCPQERLEELTQIWVGKTLILGAVLFPLLGPMDSFVAPGNFERFITYRLVISVLLFFLYHLNKLRRSIPYQYAIVAVATALSAATIELVVIESGGPDSIYYVGMILVAVCALGFVPTSVRFSFILVAIIYAIYFVPCIVTKQKATGVFVSNNVFMLSAFLIALLLRYHNQKMILTELGLRDELSRKKEKLERYSNSLEGEVSEKAGALAITEQKYRDLFDNANDGVVVLDRKGNITDANRRFCELHGFTRELLIGTNYRLLEVQTGASDVEERLGRILGGESLVYEAEHYRKDGSRVVLEISARAIIIGGVPLIQSFHRDITEKRKLQEQVLQSQKMESIGVLAGGIAHDFNNILTAILGHIEVLRRVVGPDGFAIRRIKTVEDAAKRAGQMVSKLLSFARKESLDLAPTDLNIVVRESIDLLSRALLDRNARVEAKLAADIPLVMGDSIHLEQVIANLVLNAVDAMPGGGSIIISTSPVEFGLDAGLVHPFLKKGNYVALAVSDPGTGIPAAIRDRIFDPFFTTKPAGKGTGLGLAMVYGIVKSHNGEIRLDSVEGEGTTFTIYLPVSGKRVLKHAREQTRVEGGFSARGESVLVVDDERDVLSYIRDVLDHHGYLVFLADDPEHASYLFRQLSRDIDVVITDVVMPTMSGVELARAIKEVQPAVKVIGISGYEGGEFMQAERNFDRFIKKPFDGDLLLSTVRQVLDSSVHCEHPEGPEID